MILDRQMAAVYAGVSMRTILRWIASGDLSEPIESEQVKSVRKAKATRRNANLAHKRHRMA